MLLRSMSAVRAAREMFPPCRSMRSITYWRSKRSITSSFASLNGRADPRDVELRRRAWASPHAARRERVERDHSPSQNGARARSRSRARARCRANRRTRTARAPRERARTCRGSRDRSGAPRARADPRAARAPAERQLDDGEPVVEILPEPAGATSSRSRGSLAATIRTSTGLRGWRRSGGPRAARARGGASAGARAGARRSRRGRSSRRRRSRTRRRAPRPRP